MEAIDEEMQPILRNDGIIKSGDENWIKGNGRNKTSIKEKKPIYGVWKL